VIRLAIAVGIVVAHGIPLSLNATVVNDFTTKRVVSVSVHTAPGATCTLADALTKQQVRRTTSRAGGATWRWRPSVWAEAVDTVSAHCVKGRAHRAVVTPLLLRPLQQISVIRRYALHLVYWEPSGDIPANIRPAISQLEADVKASLDAGATDTPFAVPRAYGDSLGKDDPRIVSIDSTVDTTPFPKPAEGYCGSVRSPCMGDPNLGSEVERLARVHGWATGIHTLVMVFTSPSVTVCGRFTGKNCTPQTEPCGFHDISPAGYAYADLNVASLRTSCPGRSPSDFAIGVTAHEQMEAIVDPLSNGLEIADTCEGRFSSVAVNGHAYTLPAMELPSTKCVFGYAG
jgi:hypothetical protein